MHFFLYSCDLNSDVKRLVNCFNCYVRCIVKNVFSKRTLSNQSDERLPRLAPDYLIFESAEKRFLFYKNIICDSADQLWVSNM